MSRSRVVATVMLGLGALLNFVALGIAQSRSNAEALVPAWSGTWYYAWETEADCQSNNPTYRCPYPGQSCMTCKYNWQESLVTSWPFGSSRRGVADCGPLLDGKCDQNLRCIAEIVVTDCQDVTYAPAEQ